MMGSEVKDGEKFPQPKLPVDKVDPVTSGPVAKKQSRRLVSDTARLFSTSLRSPKHSVDVEPDANIEKPLMLRQDSCSMLNAISENAPPPKITRKHSLAFPSGRSASFCDTLISENVFDDESSSDDRDIQNGKSKRSKISDDDADTNGEESDGSNSKPAKTQNDAPERPKMVTRRQSWKDPTLGDSESWRVF
mmetsp:Transcript_4476/g.6692  ORF Transcript_4476/g.6692 Transcript_4476/m.6692 type:complete len:192 (-) Transcript_4476:82-657(-)